MPGALALRGLRWRQAKLLCGGFVSPRCYVALMLENAIDSLMPEKTHVGLGFSERMRSLAKRPRTKCGKRYTFTNRRSLDHRQFLPNGNSSTRFEQDPEPSDLEVMAPQ